MNMIRRKPSVCGSDCALPRRARGLLLAATLALAGASPALAGGRYHDAKYDSDRADRGQRYTQRNDWGRKAHHRDSDDRNEVRIDINVGGYPCEPVYEERITRVWVEPVYRTVCDRVWVEPVYRTECERVWREAVVRNEVERFWVPDRWEVRTVVVGDGCFRSVRRERILVEPGHWAERTGQVVVSEGRWETIERPVLVSDGHWQMIERQELVAPGHWEQRVERVRVAERPVSAGELFVGVVAELSR
jgi:hypothetical protein